MLYCVSRVPLIFVKVIKTGKNTVKVANVPSNNSRRCKVSDGLDESVSQMALKWQMSEELEETKIGEKSLGLSF